jgi:hypothetical protein
VVKKKAKQRQRLRLLKSLMYTRDDVEDELMHQANPAHRHHLRK